MSYIPVRQMGMMGVSRGFRGLSGQTVSLVNLTTGNNAVWTVGDIMQLSISGAPKQAKISYQVTGPFGPMGARPVTAAEGSAGPLTANYADLTDLQGNWSVSGPVSVFDGQFPLYTAKLSINGVQAAKLQFKVQQAGTVISSVPKSLIPADYQTNSPALTPTLAPAPFDTSLAYSQPNPIGLINDTGLVTSDAPSGPGYAQPGFVMVGSDGGLVTPTPSGPGYATPFVATPSSDGYLPPTPYVTPILLGPPTVAPMPPDIAYAPPPPVESINPGVLLNGMGPVATPTSTTPQMGVLTQLAVSPTSTTPQGDAIPAGGGAIVPLSNAAGAVPAVPVSAAVPLVPAAFDPMAFLQTDVSGFPMWGILGGALLLLVVLGRR